MAQGYRGGNTGYPAVNAAMGAEFARNGGIRGMIQGSPDDRMRDKQMQLQMAIAQLMGKNNLDVERERSNSALALDKQKSSNTIAEKDAAVEADILKAMGWTRKDLEDPSRRAIYDQILKVRGESERNRASSDKADTDIGAAQRGVPGASVNPGYDPDLANITKRANRSSAAGPTVASDAIARLAPGQTARDTAQPYMPISAFGSGTTRADQKSFGPDGLPVETSVQQTTPGQTVLTPFL